jgi:hypothetical protein
MITTSTKAELPVPAKVRWYCPVAAIIVFLICIYL